MDGITRNLGRTTESNEFQRIGDTARESPGFNANLEEQGSLLLGRRGSPQQEVRSILVVSGRRAQERGASRPERPQFEDLACETCCQKLEPYQALSQCSACGKWTHERCQEQLDIGMAWHAVMCLVRKQKVTHWLRIVAAAEQKTWRAWNEDDWFRALLNQLNLGLRLGHSPNPDLNRLENFMATAIDVGLNSWEHPRVITPTEARPLHRIPKHVKDPCNVLPNRQVCLPRRQNPRSLRNLCIKVLHHVRGRLLDEQNSIEWILDRM